MGEYHSNWARDAGTPPIMLRGLQPQEENTFSKSGYQTLALTPRFRNLMAHETTPLEQAAARRSNTQISAPDVKVVGQGHIAMNRRGEAVYEILPNATRAMRTGRKAVPPVRISVGNKLFDPVNRGSRFTNSGRETMKGMNESARAFRQSAPNSARRASPRSMVRKHPTIDTAHRVYAPPFMNAPPRIAMPKGATSSPRSGEQENPNKRDALKIQERINDFLFRASACRRAGRRRAEANAYYSMGVLYDNNREYLKAIECYKDFAETLVLTEDKFAQALAHNSIGVSYMNWGGPGSVEEALRHHTLHRDLADVPGKFIAFTNLGLLHLRLKNAQSAAVNHQHALRCAIRMASIAGQSVAIGNLGLAAMANDDLMSARVCLERHLELTRQLGDLESERTALQKLGEIANKQGAYNDAAESFSGAWKMANETGDTQMASISKVNLGVARATVSDRKSVV